MRSLFPVAVTLGFITAAPMASAQALRVGIERAFGFAYASNTAATTSTVGTVMVTREVNSSNVTLNLFGAGFSSGVVGESILAGGTQPPRLAVDYELTNRLTIGAAAYFTWGSYAVEGSTTKTTQTGFGIAPRVGYAFAMGDRFSFWPRAGVSFGYVSASQSSASALGTASTSYLSLTLNVEPTLVYMPATHFGITATLFGDIPLVGNVTTTVATVVGGVTTERTTENTYKQLVLGLQFGLMGRF